MRRALLGFLATGFVFLVPGVAAASPIFEELGAWSSVNPLSGRVLSSGSSAAYFNPALLLEGPEGLEVDLIFRAELLDLGYQPRPSSADISEAVYDARLLDESGGTSRLVVRPLPTDRLRSRRGSLDPTSTRTFLGFGFSRILVPGRVALGLRMVAPVEGMQRQQALFPDQREQAFTNSLTFELVGDRTRMGSLALGLGVRPWRPLTLGAGVTMSASARVASGIYVPDVTYQETAEVTATSAIDLVFVPHFSLVADPWKTLRLAWTLHLESATSMEGSSDLQFWNYPYPEGEDSVVQTFSFTFGHMPLRSSLSAAWTWDLGPEQSLEVAASGNWTRWSTYLDRFGQVPTPGWDDTLAWTLGTRLTWAAHSLGLDLSWSPSPVPEQTGRTNYVDNDRLAAGGGWHWRVRVLGVPLALGLQARVERLLPRSNTKDLTDKDPVFDEFPDSVDLKSGEILNDSLGFQTNNPGWPGFSSEGWILGGSFSVKAEF